MRGVQHYSAGSCSPVVPELTPTAHLWGCLESKATCHRLQIQSVDIEHLLELVGVVGQNVRPAPCD